MTLVDTSVWIDHFRDEDKELVALLELSEVLVHELVVQELACGRIPRRSDTLALLELLPKAVSVQHAEVLMFIERRNIAASAIGCVDANLLASASLSGALVLTHDRAMGRAALRLGLLRERYAG